MRLRNCRWWLDQPHEIPVRLLTRWAELLRASSRERLQAAVEMARFLPFMANPVVGRARVRRIQDCPEIGILPEAFARAIARAQAELRLYDTLTPAQQQQLTGRGLLLPWSQMPAPARELFTRKVRLWIEPGILDENLNQSSLFLQFTDDRLLVRRLLPPRLDREAPEESLAPAPEGPPRQLVGGAVPALTVTDASGQIRRLEPRGPLLLYVVPAWPRPLVAAREDLADLKALQQMHEVGIGSHPPVLVLGAGVSPAELRDVWHERSTDLLPLAITLATGQRLGIRSKPVAFVLDASGRVTWVKEGYTPGDEDEWQRQLERVGGRREPP